MTTFSVVITCYNYANYLSKCIESVQSQTYKDFEIIIVNDGSTDDTEDVIKPYLADCRIKYIKQDNAGQAIAKNVGIRNSRGKFIAFLDADDLWVENKLEKQLPLLNNGAGVVYSPSMYIDEFGQIAQFKLESRYMKPRNGDVSKYLLFDNFIHFSSAVVRMECLNKVGCFDEKLSMGIDWDLWLRISLEYKFEYVNDPLIFYRIGHPGQMSKNLEKRFNCADSIMNNFLKRNPNIVSPSEMRKIWHYTYLTRGKYVRPINRKLSTEYLLKGYLKWPLSISTIKEIVYNYIVK